MSTPGPIEDHVMVSSILVAVVLVTNALFFIWYRKSTVGEVEIGAATVALQDGGAAAADVNASAMGAAGGTANTMDAFAASPADAEASAVPDYEAKADDTTFAAITT